MMAEGGLVATVAQHQSAPAARVIGLRRF